MKWVQVGSIARPKRKAKKVKKSHTKFLIGDMKGVFPSGYEPVWIVRLPKKGGAK